MEQVPAPLLCAIYEASAAPALWPQVIERATAWVGGVAGCFQARRLGPQLESMLVSTGIEDHQHQAYLEHHFKNDPHLTHIAALPVLRSLLSCEVLRDAELLRTEYYNDFWRPQQLRDLQGVVLIRNRHWGVSLATFAGNDRVFDESTRARLDALAPHVERALSMGFYFDGMAAAEPALHQAAQMRAVCVVRVDAALCILDDVGSPIDDDRLRGGCAALVVAHNRLSTRSAAEQDRLRAAVTLAIEGVASTHVFGRGAGALSVAFAPGPRASPFSSERCASIVFARVADARTEQAAHTFEALPDSLRAVASSLARGLTDKEIALELGYSLTTTRTYVTRVMRRLQVNNRRELMRGPSALP